jgi:hypothetical protein
MRCRCCDRRLTDAEASSKDKLTGDFFDMCRKCREWSLHNDFNDSVKEDLGDLDQFFEENMHLTRTP